jgi:hypothetical protein
MTKKIGNVCPVLAYGEPSVTPHEPLTKNGSVVQPWFKIVEGIPEGVKPQRFRICKKCGCIYVELP